MNHNQQLSNNQAQIRQIFCAALRCSNLAERTCLLTSLCGNNAELEAAVRDLLDKHAANQEFLETPFTSWSTAPVQKKTDLTDRQIAEAGTEIGGFRVVEQIGEGGFGIVFAAEQQRPVARQVALKVVKPGMDTKELISRFELEMQAMAMMDHPHIAKVYAAGTTDSGLPYFAMELFPGDPITEFCDTHQQPLRQRLRLVLDVCRAVHHAHQRGIIHRDLKPSNLLVAMHADRPVVKVIDFGISKVLDRQAVDWTLPTTRHELVGTPLYMSPEQARSGSLDVDVRSDVYSLGVLLYELLGGVTPFDRELLRSTDPSEMQRIICEVDPPHPSQQLAKLGKQRRVLICEQRSTTADSLLTALRGELDWIVGKAIEKDRRLRYQSVAELADDLEGFLNHRPISAGPRSYFYRVKKYVRAHRSGLLTAGLVAAALILATGMSIAFALRAEHQRQLADIQRRQADAARRLAAQRLDQSQRDFARAMQAFDAVVEEIGSAEFAQMPGMRQVRQELLDKMLAFYTTLTQEHNNAPYGRHQQAAALAQVASLHSLVGDHPQAATALDRSTDMLRQLVGEQPDEAAYQAELSDVLRQRSYLGKRSATDRLQDAEEALQLATGLATQQPNDWVRALKLAHCCRRTAQLLPRDSERARQLIQRSIRVLEAQGRDPLPGSLLWLANQAEQEGELQLAEEHYREAIRLFEKIGANPNKRDNYIERGLASQTWQRLAELLAGLDRPEDAFQAHRNAIELARDLREEYGQIPSLQKHLTTQILAFAKFLQSRDWDRENLEVLREAVELRNEQAQLAELQADQPPAYASPVSDARFGAPHWNLAIALKENGELQRARALARQALELVPNAKVAYRFHVRSAGTYRLWLHCSGHDDKSDSAYVWMPELVDAAGGPQADWYSLSVPIASEPETKSFYWHGKGNAEHANHPSEDLQALTWKIPRAGKYTLELIMREDGFACDTLVFQLESLPPPTASSERLDESPQSSAGIFLERDGRLVIEAEHFASRSAGPLQLQWQIVPAEAQPESLRASYRHGGYVQVLPDATDGRGDGIYSGIQF